VTCKFWAWIKEKKIESPRPRSKFKYAPGATWVSMSLYCSRSATTMRSQRRRRYNYHLTLFDITNYGVGARNSHEKHYTFDIVPGTQYVRAPVFASVAINSIKTYTWNERFLRSIKESTVGVSLECTVHVDRTRDATAQHVGPRVQLYARTLLRRYLCTADGLHSVRYNQWSLCDGRDQRTRRRVQVLIGRLEKLNVR
jgi:hypothetical protein